MVVHRYESLLSCYEREYGNIEDGITPRSVTADNHDNSYYRLLDTIQSVEEKGLYNRIRVFKRGNEIFRPKLVYCTESTLSKPNVKQVIESQRKINKQQILSNKDSFLARVKTLKDKVKQIGNKNLLNKIEQLENEFIEEIEQHNKTNKIEGR